MRNRGSTKAAETMNALWQIIRPHVFWFVLCAVALVSFQGWLMEHDQRVIAQQIGKQSQADVKNLQAQNDSLQQRVRDTQAASDRAIGALKAAATRVKTPAQAVAAIPDVSALPLHTNPLPDGKVSVDALNLYQELNTCKQHETELEQCQQVRALEENVIRNDAKIHADDQNQIQALKQKPPLLKRVWNGAKLIGIGIGIGIVLAVH